MAGTIGAYQQGPLSTPPGGGFAARTRHNAHDADATIHVQSSTLANRPGTGTAQAVWITTDGYRAYISDGAAWQEFAYLPVAGGTVTGTAVFAALTATSITDSGPATVGSLTATAGNVANDLTVVGSLTAAVANVTGGATVGGSLSAAAVSSAGRMVVGGSLTAQSAANIAADLTVGGSLTVAAVVLNGMTQLNGIRVFQQSLTPTPMTAAAATTFEQLFTAGSLSLVRTTEILFVSKPSSTAKVCIGNARITGNGTIGITYHVDITTVTPAAELYSFLTVRAF